MGGANPAQTEKTVKRKIKPLEFQDDLAEVLALAHVFQRRAGFGPGEDAIDCRAHPVQCDRAVHVVEGFAGADRNAAYDRAPVEDLQRGDLALLAPDITDHMDLAAHADRLQRLHETVGSADLDDMVDAAPAVEPAHLGMPNRAGDVVDRVAGGG